MKKVLFNNEVETISINSLKDSHFIGIKFVDPNFKTTKGHLLKINTNQYVINTLCSNNSYVGRIIYNSIQKALDGIEKEVFVFNSRKELLKWILG
jgi:hypothetical protein